MQTPTTPSLNQACDGTPTPPAKKIPTMSDVAKLTKLYELGIVSKEEVRQLVLRVCPDIPTPSDTTPSNVTPNAVAQPREPVVTPNNNAVSPRKRRRKHISRKLNDDNNTFEVDLPTGGEPAAAATPKTPTKSKNKKKKRVGKSSPTTKTLRKLAKDPTRRRFFEQCLRLDSVLWKKFGGRKAEIDLLLFARAAKDPMDSMYSQHPGVLHAVDPKKLRDIVKWQVCFICFCLLYFCLLYFCLLYFCLFYFACLPRCLVH